MDPRHPDRQNPGSKRGSKTVATGNPVWWEPQSQVLRHLEQAGGTGASGRRTPSHSRRARSFPRGRRTAPPYPRLLHLHPQRTLRASASRAWLAFLSSSCRDRLWVGSEPPPAHPKWKKGLPKTPGRIPAAPRTARNAAGDPNSNGWPCRVALGFPAQSSSCSGEVSRPASPHLRGSGGHPLWGTLRGGGVRRWCS